MEKQIDRYQLRSERLAHADELEKTDPILESLVKIKQFTLENGVVNGWNTNISSVNRETGDKYDASVVNTAETLELTQSYSSPNSDNKPTLIASILYFGHGKLQLSINDANIDPEIVASFETPVKSELFPDAIIYKIDSAFPIENPKFPITFSGPLDSFGTNTRKFISGFLEDAKAAFLK